MRTVTPNVTIQLPWPSEVRSDVQRREDKESLVHGKRLPSWEEQLARAVRAHRQIVRRWPLPITVNLLAISPRDWSPLDLEELNDQLLSALRSDLQLEADAFQAGYRQVVTGGDPGIAVIIDGEASTYPKLSKTHTPPSTSDSG